MPEIHKDYQKYLEYVVHRIKFHSERGQLSMALFNQLTTMKNKLKKKTKFLLFDSHNIRIERILDAQQRAINHYQFKSYPGRITLIRSSEYNNRSDKDWHLARWSKIAQKGLDCHVVPGDHSNILQEPRVTVLAEKIRKCAEKALAE